MAEMPVVDPPRRPGRPTRPALTEDTIAREALAIIDELGWPACTMKLLAHRLGVRSPSLYHHVDGQKGIVDLVRALVVREIHNPAIQGMRWDDAIRSFGIAYYRAFSGHPNTIQVLSMTPVRDRDTLIMYETFLQTLVGQGWELPRAFEALLGLEHLALGFAYEWNAEDLMLDPAVVAAQGAPLLAEVTRDRTDQASDVEHTFMNLLGRHIEMFRHEVDESKGPHHEHP
ncbi:TetR/AcrR family transcriptional regulator C-terminal domain-containing protein [Leucobacter sp. Z1108]|uniref:TetR/AcrR family transcriptional regulator C-terminal domain-containing protein n=1 Tax=Leucobacter sp. Z1108 TaxID=3439066 RepID=UPI003F32E365